VAVATEYLNCFYACNYAQNWRRGRFLHLTLACKITAAQHFVLSNAHQELFFSRNSMGLSLFCCKIVLLILDHIFWRKHWVKIADVRQFYLIDPACVPGCINIVKMLPLMEVCLQKHEKLLL
jgi:hypothetical protein